MRFKGWIVLMSLTLWLMATTAGAIDYKQWIPALPETVGNMPRSGESEGMNMESGDQSWSMVHQRYGEKESEKSVEITIVWGAAAPMMANIQAMSKMEMETEDVIIKTVEVSKYKGIVNIEKKENRGTVMVVLADQLMLIMMASPATSQAELVTLAEGLPLERFAQVK